MDLFKKGQKLTIFFLKGANMVEMTCIIEDVLFDRLILNPPQYFMRYINYLQTGQHLMAKAFARLGTIDFNTIIISSPLEDVFAIELDMNALKLTPGAELPVIEAIETIDVLKDDGVIKLKTFELSTEYLKFYSDIKFQVEESFDCILNLPKDYGIIKFRATVSEIDPVYDNEYTVTYSNMTEDDRQTLLYYMYMYSNITD